MVIMASKLKTLSKNSIKNDIILGSKSQKQQFFYNCPQHMLLNSPKTQIFRLLHRADIAR